MLTCFINTVHLRVGNLVNLLYVPVSRRCLHRTRNAYFLSSNADGQPVRIGPDKCSLYDAVVSMAKVGFLLLSVLRSLV